MFNAAGAVRATPLDDILLIQLADPSGFPRLTRAVLAELDRHVDTLSQTRALRAAIVTGTERAFAAGAELAEVGALAALEALRFSSQGQSVLRKIERLDKPVVAAIQGHCLGGGFDLALACTIRVATTNAVFGHPGAKLGIITGWGGTQRLPRIVGPKGRARVVEMLMTGAYLTAVEALACGLVNRVVHADALIPTAIRVARQTGRAGQAPSRPPFSAYK